MLGATVSGVVVSNSICAEVVGVVSSVNEVLKV